MHTYDSLQPGDSFTFQRVISEKDVAMFAEVTGDDNPLHVDPEYAATTRFGKPIVHGVLLLGIISKVLGRDFPGHDHDGVDDPDGKDLREHDGRPSDDEQEAC